MIYAMQKNIIGLSGFARAGKDTAAAYYVSLGYEKRAFADPLRIEAMKVPEWRQKVEEFGYEEAKTRFPFIRQTLVDIGQAAREIEPLIWVDLAFGIHHDGYQNLGPIKGPTVFSDVRNANEANAIRSAGGIVIMIKRNGIGPANSTEAETIQRIVADYVVENNGTIDELWARLSGKI